MMPGCKEGDLAKFIPPAPDVYLGKLVGVGKRCPEHGDSWLIKPLQPIPQIRALGFFLFQVEDGMREACCPDRILKPIRPGDLEGEHPGDKLLEPTNELARELDKFLA